jgi:hypothetical protein
MVAELFEIFSSNKSSTKCNNFPIYYPDVYLHFNMFWALSRPSSGAQWLQWQPLVLPSYRGGSRAVFVGGGGGYNCPAHWMAETCRVIRCVKYAFIHLCAVVGFDIIRNCSVHVYGPFKTLKRFILILSSILRLGLWGSVFPSGFPTETLYVHFVPRMQGTCPADLILLDLIAGIIFGVE